jgi:hypothetical protein
MIIRIIIGALVGGVVGYGLYRVMGCSSGACPLTSNPWISTGYGVLMGVLLSGAGR